MRIEFRTLDTGYKSI